MTPNLDPELVAGHAEVAQCCYSAEGARPFRSVVKEVAFVVSAVSVLNCVEAYRRTEEACCLALIGPIWESHHADASVEVVYYQRGDLRFVSVMTVCQ